MFRRSGMRARAARSLDEYAARTIGVGRSETTEPTSSCAGFRFGGAVSGTQAKAAAETLERVIAIASTK
jgi:hypothetical protein